MINTVHCILLPSMVMQVYLALLSLWFLIKIHLIGNGKATFKQRAEILILEVQYSSCLQNIDLELFEKKKVSARNISPFPIHYRLSFAEASSDLYRRNIQLHRFRVQKLSVCMSVCLPVCMPICLYVCMSVCLYVCLTITLVVVFRALFTRKYVHQIWWKFYIVVYKYGQVMVFLNCHTRFENWH